MVLRVTCIEQIWMRESMIQCSLKTESIHPSQSTITTITQNSGEQRDNCLVEFLAVNAVQYDVIYGPESSIWENALLLITSHS